MVQQQVSMIFATAPALEAKPNVCASGERICSRSNNAGNGK